MPARTILGWSPRTIRGAPTVSIAVACYRQPDELACLLYSFRSQTYDHWEAIVVHDGPGPEARAVVEQLGDPRVVFVEAPEHKGQWGHPWRQLGIDRCTGDFIGLSNADSYYAPVYFEWMLSALLDFGADFVCCNMVHSSLRWAPLSTKPVKGGLDVGAWIARAALVKATPWRDLSYTGDGTYIEDLHARADGIAHVHGYLFVHN
jgi:glycosyltransferase involved in cell wall biosynthesis